MERQRGWEQRLFKYTCSMLSVPFEYGKNDCILFAASCVEAVTGEDPASEHRGTYSTETGALRIILESGAQSLGEFVGLYLPEKPVALMQRGDVGIFDGPDGEFVAVCQGKESVGPTSRGLIHVKTIQAKQAFKV
jgi:hypothetical protein